MSRISNLQLELEKLGFSKQPESGHYIVYTYGNIGQDNYPLKYKISLTSGYVSCFFIFGLELKQMPTVREIRDLVDELVHHELNNGE